MGIRFLRRIPPESKAAAVVLGAALAQVGLLSVLGLRSSSDRRESLELQLEGRALDVVSVHVIERVRDAVAAKERAVDAAVGRKGAPLEERIGEALTAGKPAVSRAYLVRDDGTLVDWRRRLYPPVSPGPREQDARERLDEVLRLEAEDPEAAVRAAVRLADDAEGGAVHDAVAVALALQAGARAALVRDDAAAAERLALRLLDRYRTLKDDRGVAGESEPFGLSAAAVLCEARRGRLAPGSDAVGAAFVDAVLDRRHQVQRMEGVSPAAVRVEIEECKRLLAEMGLAWVDRSGRLERGLAECDAIDAGLLEVRSVPASLVRKALATGERTQVPGAGRDVDATLRVLPLAGGEAGGEAGSEAGGEVGAPAGVAFVSEGRELRRHALEAASVDLPLQPGLELVIRDAENRTLLGPRGVSFIEELPFGDAAPGLRAGAVAANRELLFREIQEARTLWLWILGGAGLAVLAACLLGARAVLREVRLARMKGDFVSNLSHELRTPLTSLRMFVETLQEGRVRDEQEARECLDVVARETDRLSEFVERILSFAAFSRGRAPMRLESGDAGAVARQAAELFGKRAEAVGVRLEVQVADGLPESIVDRHALIQVLLNLLDNAVKYGGDNGGRVRLSVSAAGERVRIDVEDDGAGVPERERDLVFEDFYRGDESLSGRVQGTGIGLALARRIVQAHGGTIEVGRSQALGGARFRVTLPGATEGRRLAVAAAAGGAQG